MKPDASFKVTYADPETGEGSDEAVAHLVNIAHMLAQGSPVFTESLLLAAAALSGHLNGQTDEQIIASMHRAFEPARMIYAELMGGAPDGPRAH